MKKKLPLLQRISFRQAIQTVVVTFILGLVLSGVQISADLVKEKDRVHVLMSRLVAMVQESAAQSVYFLDKSQATRVVSGLLEYAPVCEVRLVDDFGTVFVHQKRRKTTTWMAGILGTPFRENCSFSYPLTFYPNPSLPERRSMGVGYISLSLDPYLVAKSFWNRSGMLLGGDIIRNVLLAFVLALMFYATVTRPLLRLVESITAVDLSKAGQRKIRELRGHAKDELGLLTGSINAMLFEIDMLNQGLEARVQDRTRELAETNKTLEASLEELNQAQAQLVQAEKMAALGGLVAGVAHEISTPLGISVTLASFLEKKIAETSGRLASGGMFRAEMDAFLQSGLEAAEVISKNLYRAAELIDSFKQVAVDQTSGKKRSFKMKSHLQDVLVSLNPRIRKTRHKIFIECPEDLKVYQDPGAFSHIFTNLVMNSLIHGFDGLKEGTIRLSIRVADDVMKWRYADNGNGISEKTKARIFDPFYTTKRGQGGTGLGMHIIFNIVTQTLKGRISCDGSLGNGILIDIDIPMEHLAEPLAVAQEEAS